MRDGGLRADAALVGGPTEGGACPLPCWPASFHGCAHSLIGVKAAGPMRGPGQGGCLHWEEVDWCGNRCAEREGGGEPS